MAPATVSKGVSSPVVRAAAAAGAASGAGAGACIVGDRDRPKRVVAGGGGKQRIHQSFVFMNTLYSAMYSATAQIHVIREYVFINTYSPCCPVAYGPYGLLTTLRFFRSLDGSTRSSYNVLSDTPRLFAAHSSPQLGWTSARIKISR